MNSHDPPKIYGTHPVPATGNLQKHGERVDMLIQKRLGMAVRSITAEEASTFHLNPGERLVIKRLNPTSSAAYSGLEVNDILLEINGQPIIGLEHLTRVIRPMGHRQRVVMFVLDHRTGRKGYVQIYTR